MNEKEYDLNSLVSRMRRGDGEAKVLLRRQLEPAIVRMVRCTLKTGIANHPVARRTLAEVRRLGGMPRWPRGELSEQLIGTVARRVLDGMMADFGDVPTPRRWSMDTVPAA